ncbi:MAG: hypothetical protein IJT88_09510 [Kiritimatiellae bacterium]|nr:hypothetical protein [Kiritimatiellia bacterium]
MMAMVNVGAVLAERARRQAEMARKEEARKQRRRDIEDAVAFAVALGPVVFFAVAFVYGAVKLWLGL